MMPNEKGAPVDASLRLTFHSDLPRLARLSLGLGGFTRMNPFVNFNKRDVQLPKGCTDLVDVLRAKKCEYCDDVAVATVGWPGDYRWCEACQRDLAEFAAQQDYSVVHAGFKDEAAIAEYRADFQRRQDDFMRERVRQRKPQ